MKSVLVTGATTPVGAALCRALLEAGDRVLAVGIEPGDETELPLDDDRFRYETTDLTRERSVRKLVFGAARELGVRAVVHNASHRSLLDEGERVHQINVGATRTEDHPLELSSRAPQRVRDRVAADLTVCTRMGMSPVKIAVLRMAEVLAPATGSQLYDYLSSEHCLRPVGFNPMVNVLSIADAAAALVAAVDREAVGVFNIPGRDSLPLKSLIERWGRRDVPVPGPALSPLYRLRRRVRHTEFIYAANRGRLHTSDLLDGGRARAALGYVPATSIDWPA